MIPFNRALLLGPELDAMREAVAAGHIAGNGPFTRKCHALLEREVGGSKALLTTSCTHALEMAALLLNMGPGDCPVTERVSDQILRLPFFTGLSEPDQDRVIAAVLGFPL